MVVIALTRPVPRSSVSRGMAGEAGFRAELDNNDSGVRSVPGRDSVSTSAPGLGSVSTQDLGQRSGGLRSRASLSDMRRDAGSAISDSMDRQASELQEMIAGSGAKTLPALALMLAFPLAKAVRMQGVKWALQRGTFSVCVAPAVASALLVVGCAVALCTRHGFQALSPTSHWAFAKIALSALLGGATTCLQNLSLSMVPPPVTTALAQTSILFAACLQYCLLNMIASLTQLTSVACTVCLAANYVIKFCDSESQSSTYELVGGLSCAVGGALSLSLFAMAFQCTAQQSSELTAAAGGSVQAEQLRCIIAAGLGGLLVSILFAIGSDLPFLMEFGLFGGWSVEVLLLAVTPLVLVTLMEQALLIRLGSHLTSIVACMEVVCVYLLDMALSSNVTFNIAPMLKLIALTLGGCIYSLCALDVQLATRSVKSTHLEGLSEVAQCKCERAPTLLRSSAAHTADGHIKERLNDQPQTAAAVDVADKRKSSFTSSREFFADVACTGDVSVDLQDEECTGSRVSSEALCTGGVRVDLQDQESTGSWVSAEALFTGDVPVDLQRQELSPEFTGI